MQNFKALIRKEILNKRTLLNQTEVREKSTRVFDKLLELSGFKSSKTVMCYVDFKNEVMTGDIIKYCLEHGKRVAVPVIAANNGGHKEMWASELFDFESELEKGTLGILEPKKDLIRRMEASRIDLVVIPGVAFDAQGGRIGYGAGFYDRFLKNTRKECLKIGIAFELQLVDNVPADEHDVAMDMIITEDRILTISLKGSGHEK